MHNKYDLLFCALFLTFLIRNSSFLSKTRSFCLLFLGLLVGFSIWLCLSFMEDSRCNPDLWGGHGRLRCCWQQLQGTCHVDCNTGVFVAAAITCIFTGRVGGNEAAVWPGPVREINDLHCISWRFDLIAAIHVPAQFLQLGWVTSNAIKYLLRKNSLTFRHSPSYWVFPRSLWSQPRHASF